MKIDKDEITRIIINSIKEVSEQSGPLDFNLPLEGLGITDQSSETYFRKTLVGFTVNYLEAKLDVDLQEHELYELAGKLNSGITVDRKSSLASFAQGFTLLTFALAGDVNKEKDPSR